MSAPGEPFLPGFNHAGDRVIYNGKEYRVQNFSGRTNLAFLVSDTDPNDIPGQVNMNHLTMSWCPRSHGGHGNKPDNTGHAVTAPTD